MRIKFLLRTDSGYPKDTGVILFTLATPGNPLRYNTHRSAPPVSALLFCFLRLSRTAYAEVGTQRHGCAAAMLNLHATDRREGG